LTGEYAFEIAQLQNLHYQFFREDRERRPVGLLDWPGIHDIEFVTGGGWKGTIEWERVSVRPLS